MAEWRIVGDESQGPAGPTVGQILNYRRADGQGEPYSIQGDIDAAPPGMSTFDFFVKWQEKAHYHAEWKPYAELAKLEGAKRIQHYYKKIILAEYYYYNNDEISAEDKEGAQFSRLAKLDELNDYSQIERIIDRSSFDGTTEYLVKWKSLPYNFCTWEDAAFVSEHAQEAIDKYLDRSQKHPVSNKAESNPATRRPHQNHKDQPEYVKGGTLRPFQIVGLNFLCKSWTDARNVILADEMGLGKTVQTIAFMSWLCHDRGQQGPFIVVVPLSTMPAWADTFNTWAPDINYVVYNGNVEARGIIRDKEMFVGGDPLRPKFNVLLTTYEFILQDYKVLAPARWQFMAVDEAHRLKNAKSILYERLVQFGATSRLLITGTPIQNEMKELSALMSFLDPKQQIVDETFDWSADDVGARVAQLSAEIKLYMVRRVKSEAVTDLPEKSEKIIRLHVSDLQQEYYKNILTRNVDALKNAAKGENVTLNNIMMQLKKVSNHPFLFPGAESKLLGDTPTRDETLRGIITSSGKMMLLDRLMSKLKQEGHRVLIFSQFIGMLDILGQYLTLRSYGYQRLDGTIATRPRNLAIQHFNAPDSEDFAFILSTRAGGLGINLATADTVILFDSDWNPQMDLQAMARAHRIGQTKPVTVYRLVSRDTVEEEILERARNKLMLEYLTIRYQHKTQDPKNNVSEADLNSKGYNTKVPAESAEIQRLIKKRSQKMFEKNDKQKELEELDIDAVIADAEIHETTQAKGLGEGAADDEFLKQFQYTDVKLDEKEWDDIIPKEEREKMKKEEDAAKEEARKKAAEQPASKKRKAPESDDRQVRAAKKRARELTAAVDSDDDQTSEGAEADPKRPLTEKEIRGLVRASERYGFLDDRTEEFIREARLIGRDIDVIKATLDDMFAIAKQKLKDNQERLDAQQAAAGKVIAKKERKAVVFEYHGIKNLNAETLVERAPDLQTLKGVVDGTSNFKKFRVVDASKPADYDCEWGAREDGMLCVGMVRHGFGAWREIEKDPDLDMESRFFLNEDTVAQKQIRENSGGKKRTPAPVHIVRRANYLFSVLRANTSNGADPAARKALENHHRNNKKNSLAGSGFARGDSSTRASASPAPGGIRKKVKHRLSDAHRRPEQSREIDKGRYLKPRELTDDRDRSRERNTKPNGIHKERTSSGSTPFKKEPGSGSDDMERFFRPIMKQWRPCEEKYTWGSKNGSKSEMSKAMINWIDLVRDLIEEKHNTISQEFEDRCWYVRSSYRRNLEIQKLT